MNRFFIFSIVFAFASITIHSANADEPTKDSSGLLTSKSGITADGYVYQQAFMPKKMVEIDLAHTAIFITDPQNDFLSPKGGAWPLVGEEVVASKVVEHEKLLIATAREIGIRVFYSPHMYTKKDYKYWDRSKLNGIDQIMFNNNMFIEGSWGHEFHPELQPDENTIVMNPHKGLSNFWTGDASIQLRQNKIQTIVLCGMACNMCVESHWRDAIENGFEVIIVADCTAGAGPLAKKAALVNYEFLANEVVTTKQIVKRLHAAKK